MHELSIASRILDAIVTGAEAEGALRITRLRVQVGRVSGVSPEALAFAMQVVSPGTRAEGLELDIETVELVLRCRGCSEQSPAESLLFTCPACGGQAVDIVRGRELRLVDMDIDT
ncbi:MAG: hydrogenase maturation nickel metallochaperone HypA [Deltaproteobacteria bacterium]|nr:hydrogenase maturation nickel metallochaperone HypA [Deltaproteobacteria bacterium]